MTRSRRSSTRSGSEGILLPEGLLYPLDCLVWGRKLRRQGADSHYVAHPVLQFPITLEFITHRRDKLPDRLEVRLRRIFGQGLGESEYAVHGGAKQDPLGTGATAFEGDIGHGLDPGEERLG